MRILNFGWLALLLLLQLQAKSDEGMWLPSLLSRVNENIMYELGAELSADDIYNINSSSLKDAIVALNGGSCTGEMVSAEGLFLTNHHCGYSQIHRHSTEENNYLRDGFWASSREEELPNTGMTVSYIIRVDDVTEKALNGVTDEMSENERDEQINENIKEIRDTEEADSHYSTSVKNIFDGNQYILVVYEVFKDIRLVGAPPHFIGKFGGSTDNWMWPRHTGDFALFRVYAGPDGKPAAYSEDNVPYEPKHYLPVSLKGYKEGDFSMVMGFPGSTNRYLTSDGVESVMQNTNQARITFRGPKLEIISNYMATSEKATLQYANEYAGSSNYYKYSIGQNEGLYRLGVVKRKKAIENEFSQWLEEDEARKDKYGTALTMLNDTYENSSVDKAYMFMYEAFYRGPKIFTLAGRFYSLMKLLEDEADDKEVSEMAEKLLSSVNNYYDNYDLTTDMKIATSLTAIYAQHVDSEFYPPFIKNIEDKYKGNYRDWTADLYKKSIFLDRDKITKFLERPRQGKLEKDPLYQAARDLSEFRSDLYKERSEKREMRKKGYRLYMAGLLEMYEDREFYPNANSTLRLTYGSVGSYEPRDGVEYDYYTTIDGYKEKVIPGDREFDVWPEFLELLEAGQFGQYADEDGTLHTCFISNNDITGGNSGSPVINAEGELIGIAFDGNWEAMSGDIAFEPDLQRCINVDIRFVLWVIDKFAGASHLVEEMELVK